MQFYFNLICGTLFKQRYMYQNSTLTLHMMPQSTVEGYLEHFQKENSLLHVQTILCNLSNKEEVTAICFILTSFPFPSLLHVLPLQQNKLCGQPQVFGHRPHVMAQRMHIRTVVLGLCDGISNMRLSISFLYLIHLWKALYIKQRSNPWPYET